MLAIFHDTIITIGLFSLFNQEISLTVIAALLTLIGYSMNDKIVIFDRVRENLKSVRREGSESLVNRSINQTLSRTILTAGPTLFDGALYSWAGRAERHCLRVVDRNYCGHVFLHFRREPDSGILAELLETRGRGRPHPASRAKNCAVT